VFYATGYLYYLMPEYHSSHGMSGRCSLLNN